MMASQKFCDNPGKMEETEKEVSMKKIPWGPLFWFFLTDVFFLTMAIIVVYMVLNAIAGATSGSITIFQNWYQILLFVLDVICACLMGICTFFYFNGKRKKEKTQ